MASIDVYDTVEIIATDPAEKQHLHKVGKVMVVIDGTKCIVQFSDGSGGAFKTSQLRKVR